MRKTVSRIVASMVVASMLISSMLMFAGCTMNQADIDRLSQMLSDAGAGTGADAGTGAQNSTEDAAGAAGDATDAAAPTNDEVPAEEKNGEIYILFTSDIHCGIDQGFGLAGLKQIRDELEKQGYETLLVDDGDTVQGEPVGTITNGDAVMKLLNELDYDVAIPGNHDFDYGMEHFFELVEMANFPYICCNFTHNGELVFDPYIIKEAAGHKIGFVGVTTPETLTTSTPKYFQDDAGNFIYGFMQEDQTGEAVYKAVQDAVDAVRKEGAEYVYVMGHMGNEKECEPWTYADIISNTNGIDVFLDGHSHDTDQVVMKNKDGVDVPRSAVGTKLNCIGYSHINADGEIDKTGIWSWPNTNKDAVPSLLGIENDMEEKVEEALDALQEQLGVVVAHTDYDLTINDPELTDDSGNPIRMVRRAETNLGDLCADAYRDQSGADVAIVNGGGVRDTIKKGDITYGDIISVHPFGNELCVLEVTGQQILDALEWGARSVPDENGAFEQVSGMTFEINTKIETSCSKDEDAMFSGITGERRVQNVMIGDEPLDPKKKYTLAGHNYTLEEKGGGFTMFEGAPILQDKVKLDNQVLIDYITETLGGNVGEEYADPHGQGRIVILE